MNKNYLLIILAATFWGTMGIFVTGLSSIGFDTIQISMVRAFFSLLLISAIILCKDRKLFKINLRDIWMFLGSGLASYFLFNVCYFIAIGKVGVAVASVLLYTSPIFVTLMSCVLFREKMTQKKLLSLTLAFLGCALVSGIFSGESVEISVSGILFGLGSGFAFALYGIFSTYALRKYQPLTVTFYTFLFGTAAAMLIGNVADTLSLVATARGILWALALGVISGALPYFLYTSGLARVKASHASVIATLEPVVASLIGIFLYKEHAGTLTVIGIILIISASVLLNFSAEE